MQHKAQCCPATCMQVQVGTALDWLAWPWGSTKPDICKPYYCMPDSLWALERVFACTLGTDHNHIDKPSQLLCRSAGTCISLPQAATAVSAVSASFWHQADSRCQQLPHLCIPVRVGSCINHSELSCSHPAAACSPAQAVARVVKYSSPGTCCMLACTLKRQPWAPGQTANAKKMSTNAEVDD